MGTPSVHFYIHFQNTKNWSALTREVKIEPTLKEKRVLNQCPWGTVLENSPFFDKKGTILVLHGHQHGHHPRSTTLSIKVGHEWHQNGAPKGTILRTIRFGATFFLVYSWTVAFLTVYHSQVVTFPLRAIAAAAIVSSSGNIVSPCTLVVW